MASTKKIPDGAGQIKKFQDAARQLECDESEERFDAALKRVAKTKPQKDEKKKSK